MFLSVGESFTSELTDVRLVSPIHGTPPRLLHEASAATVTVPEEAASSEVSCGCGFFCSFIFISPLQGTKDTDQSVLLLVWLRDISLGCIFMFFLMTGSLCHEYKYMNMLHLFSISQGTVIY